MLKGRLHDQRGMSLVELMVGVTVGLFVVASAAMVVGTQLGDNRKLLAETQLQQDLRSTLDIITRELRRAGYSTTAGDSVWPPVGAPTENPFDGITVSGGNQIVFRYRRASGQEGPYGFKYDLSSKAVLTQLAAAGWQELTDSRSLQITAFTITPVDSGEVILPCPKMCADATTNCWPRQSVREYVIAISGQAVADPTVNRSLQSIVRLRNDLVRYMDPLNPSAFCPA